MLKKLMMVLLSAVCMAGLMAQEQVVNMPSRKWTRREFLSRDPFILAWEKNQTYYLYKSTSYTDAEGKKKVLPDKVVTQPYSDGTKTYRAAHPQE